MYEPVVDCYVDFTYSMYKNIYEGLSEEEIKEKAPAVEELLKAQADNMISNIKSFDINKLAEQLRRKK